jgi:serine/threonine protein kinase/Flp pilus assembly protein TadD
MNAQRIACQDEDPRLAQVLDSYLAAAATGAAPSRDELLARYPDIADDLAECLASLDFIHRAAVKPVPTDDDAGAGVRPEAPLGDYRILREIGRGGMGVVYEAVQISLGRRVALKVLPYAAMLDARQLKRFKNEAQAAAALHHTNIVPVFAVGCERGVHYYAMQYIEGQTLARLIADLREAGQVGKPSLQIKAEYVENSAHEDSTVSAPTEPVRTVTTGQAAADTPPAAHAALSTQRCAQRATYFRNVADLGVQIAKALNYAHDEGVLHRDIKPSNLILDQRGRVWITDFGLAHIENDGTLTMTGDLLGTLRYMSPEQALAKRVVVDHRSDIYSLGATLYELMTLRPAFDGDDRQELLRKIAFEEPLAPRRFNKAVPAELETIVLKAMEKDQADRYATAQELADDLQRFLEDRPIQAKPPSLLQRARKWSRRHQAVLSAAAVGMLLVVAILAGSVGWIVRDRAERRQKMGREIATAVSDAENWYRRDNLIEALAAVKRAVAPLASGEGRADLRERIAELSKDLEMVRRLEEIRLPRARDGIEGHYDNAWADESYGEAFREYGIDVESLDAGEAAERIRGRTIAAELTVALDQWAHKRQLANKEGWDRLIAVAKAADRDEWRNQLRDAVVQRKQGALLELAASPKISSLPLQTLSLLGAAIQDAKAGAAVLRQAQRKYPNDFWINFQLAWSLGSDDAVRFYTVAAALRPRNAPVHFFLGHALEKRGKRDEAIAAYIRAIELQPGLGGHPYNVAIRTSNLAFDLAEDKKLAEALAAQERIVELLPSDAAAWHGLGFLYLRQEKFDAAIAAYRNSIELKGDNPRVHRDLGVVLRLQNQRDAAIGAFRTAVEWLAELRGGQREGFVKLWPDVRELLTRARSKKK